MNSSSSQCLDAAKGEEKVKAMLPVAGDKDAPPPSEKSNSLADPEFVPDWRFYTSFGAIAIISLMAALDATSLSVALPIMARLLGGSAIEAFWSGTSFLLTSTVFQPIIGSFSHIFGRKPLTLISLALFGAGSVVAAVADNFTVILVGRSIQGIGGGGSIVMAEIILTDMIPLRERGKWLSVINGMWSVGTVVGPLLGGGFAQNVTWRWIFWINLPFIAIGAVMVVFFLRLNYPTSSFLAKLRRVDWIGMALFLASLTGFLIPITWGGVQYPWNSWRTLVPLTVCASGLVFFIVHQEFIAPDPLIRTRVAKTRTAGVTYFQTIIHGSILWATLYYLPLYYEGVKGYSLVISGVAIFPQTFTVAPSAVVCGIAVSVTGRYRWAIWIGWLLTTLGLGLMTLLDHDSTVPEWIFLNIVSGVGCGMLFPSMAIAIQASTSNEDQAYSISMFSFVRSLGQTLGVAIGGVVFQNQINKKLRTFPLLAPDAAELSKDAAGLVEIIKMSPEGDVKHQLRVSYAYALKYIWIVVCALSALALFSSVFIKGYPLDRTLETEHGFKAKVKPSDVEDGSKPES